jgi:hypothetical protein
MRYTLRNQPTEHKEYVTINGIEAEYTIRDLGDKLIVIQPYIKAMKTVSVIATKICVITNNNSIDIIRYMINSETFKAENINSLLERN